MPRQVYSIQQVALESNDRVLGKTTNTLDNQEQYIPSIIVTYCNIRSNLCTCLVLAPVLNLFG